jgi:endonuclease/exonuclease/phosphatase family metal-dependent hydrolase
MMRSSYLREGAADATIVGNRSKMTSAYLSDVASASAFFPLPSKSSDARCVRVAQYNMNTLAGADWKSPKSGEEADAVLAFLGADVLLLQEADTQSFPDRAPFNKGVMGAIDQDATNTRVHDLHARLRERGYTLISSDGCFNPPLLATRLPVLDASAAFVADRGPTVAALDADGGEFRTARCVLLDAGQGRTLRVVSAHLHHNESASLRGSRLAEAAHILERLDALSGAAPAQATVVAGDFNCGRERDYSPAEWDVVTRGLANVNQPPADGVSEAFEAAGYRTTYDLSGAGQPGLTHWTGTAVDFAYVKGATIEVAGVHMHYTTLSDHLPVIHDLLIPFP